MLIAKKKAPSSSPEKTAPPAVAPNGQLELRWVDPRTLDDNPQNWRVHPQRQHETLNSLMNSVGWAGAGLYNLTTGRLIDGHERKKLAIERGESMPVLVGKWTEAQERQILLLHDPIAAMAETNAKLLQELNDRVDKDLGKARDSILEKDRETFARVQNQLEEQAAAIEFGAPAAFFADSEELTAYAETGHAKGREALKASTPFNLEDLDDEAHTSPDSNSLTRLASREEMSWDAWGQGATLDIPNLRTDRLGTLPKKITTWLGPETQTAPDLSHFYIWGSASVEKCNNLKDLIVAFYTEDAKFEVVWSKPEKIATRLLRCGVRYFVAPNFSCLVGCHRAFDIWQTYRSRWVSRYFQEAGLHCIPDLMLTNLEPDHALQWRFAGIPKRCPVVAAELQSKGDLDAKDRYLMTKAYLKKAIEYLEPQSLLLYVPPDLPKNFLADIKIPYRTVETFMSGRSRIIREKAKSGELLTNTMADAERTSTQKKRDAKASKGVKLKTNPQTTNAEG